MKILAGCEKKRKLKLNLVVGLSVVYGGVYCCYECLFSRSIYFVKWSKGCANRCHTTGIEQFEIDYTLDVSIIIVV